MASPGTSPGLGRSARDRLYQLRRGALREPGAAAPGAGHDQRPGLADRLGPLPAGAAPGHHQRNASTAPPRPRGAPRRSPGPGGAGRVTASSGSDLPCCRCRSCRSGRSRLHHPHPGRGQIAGPARPRSCRCPEPPGSSEVPETAQPAGQFPVPGCCGGELLHAQQPGQPSRAAATCRSACVSTPPVMARVSSPSVVIAVPFHG